MWTRKFWLDTIERVIRYSAATLASLIVGNATSLLDVDWPGVLGVTGMGALATFLLSVAGSQIGDPTSASLLKPGPPETP